MEINYACPCEVFVAFDLTTEVCIARIDRDSARVSFLDTASRAELGRVPADARLVRLEDDRHVTCPIVGNSFIIHWARSYALYSGQYKVLDIANERMQRVHINETYA